ncbi:MAG: hypothetical protein AAGB14_12635 [Verrucomicrobiota bacterium]
MGITAKGVVLTVEEPEYVSGKSGNGREYAFWSRKIDLLCDKTICKLSESTEGPQNIDDPSKLFTPVGRGATATFAIERCRMDGRTMVFSGHFIL